LTNAGLGREQTPAEEFGVARSDIEVMFGRKNVNKQLRIKLPKVLPAGVDWPRKSGVV
jgi:uncharacterized protein YggU (UPF0235/DUF167 family)